MYADVYKKRRLNSFLTTRDKFVFQILLFSPILQPNDTNILENSKESKGRLNNTLFQLNASYFTVTVVDGY